MKDNDRMEKGQVDKEMKDNDRMQKGRVDHEMKDNDRMEKGQVDQEMKDNDRMEKGQVDQEMKDNDRMQKGEVDKEMKDNDRMEKGQVDQEMKDNDRMEKGQVNKEIRDKSDNDKRDGGVKNVMNKGDKVENDDNMNTNEKDKRQKEERGMRNEGDEGENDKLDNWDKNNDNDKDNKDKADKKMKDVTDKGGKGEMEKGEDKVDNWDNDKGDSVKNDMGVKNKKEKGEKDQEDKGYKKDNVLNGKGGQGEEKEDYWDEDNDKGDKGENVGDMKNTNKGHNKERDMRNEGDGEKEKLVNWDRDHADYDNKDKGDKNTKDKTGKDLKDKGGKGDDDKRDNWDKDKGGKNSKDKTGKDLKDRRGKGDNDKGGNWDKDKGDNIKGKRSNDLKDREMDKIMVAHWDKSDVKKDKARGVGLFRRLCPRLFGGRRTAFAAPPPPRPPPPPSPQIREHCKALQLSDDQLRQMMASLLENIQRGLQRSTHDAAIVKCFVTYVQDLPNGTERGKFMALDLGGTNFRVLLIELGDHKHFEMKSKIFAIPDYIMTGPGQQLFDHIAECLATFMKEHHLENEVLPLGFTFSFPCTQKGLTKGYLVRWTKGFNCKGVIGQDVVKLLEQAISRRNDVRIDITAILNDTTGTLMSCAWKKNDCKIGLIVGTGSNACYVEKVENAEMFDGDRSKPYVLINTEWGAFGDNGDLDFVRTEYDEEIDQHSINPGTQKHEKMISGMYMGELVRLVIVKMTHEGLLFGGKGSDLLFERGSFLTKYVSEIEADKPNSYTACRVVLNELGLKHATDKDCANIRYICQVVSTRAAYLASAGVATLINKIHEEKVTVGIDGSVYRYHPHFHHLMMEKIGQLVEPGLKFDIMLSEDGSGRGAALVAAVASRDVHKGIA